MMTVVPIAPRIGRPAPPSELTAEQQEIWRAVVNRMPADWFDAASAPVLADYCCHITRSRVLSRAVDAVTELRDAEQLKHYKDLISAAELETRAILACARALRLTPRARIRPETAGRRHARGPGGPKPWDLPEERA